MERLSGALMVLAGVALGAYSLLPATSETASNPATQVASEHDARLVAPPTVVPTVAAAPAVRVFSPNAPLVAATPGATGASTTTWTAVVTAERATGSNFKSAKAGDAEARAALTSDLQRELKRVGCYGGEINGAWTQSTRRAMGIFMERVNATLPANEPDYILLTLVQGHTALVCSTGCPAGEVYGSDGRCLPAAVVAQANKRAQRLEERLAERREIEQRKAAQQEQLAAEQRVTEARRIALAQRAEAERLAASRTSERRKTAQRLEAQRLEAEQAAQRVATAKTTTASIKTVNPAQVAAVNSERLPWLDDPTIARFEQTPAATTPAAASADRGAPLPGMMSVGGPRGATQATLPPSAAVGEPAAHNSFVHDGIDRDGLTDQRNYTITAPEPRPAVRPVPAVRDAALVTGLPGTKSGPDARLPSKVRKVGRHASPYSGGPRVKRKYYAYESTGKTRRGQPRAGTARYNMMLSLGGIY